MNKIPGLSVIIITRDEEKDIEACLQSIANIADEVVLVDSGSTDRTLDIVRPYTDKIFHHEWNGYAEQKQFAHDRAKGPWILNIDADERVSPALQEEIQRVLSDERSHDVQGFEVPFRHYFLGKRLRFGGGREETHIRLFRKDGSRYGKKKVHEGIQVEGRIKRLDNPIDHYSYRDVSDYLKKCDWYTSLIAKEKFTAGDRFHWWCHLRLPYEFVVRYLLKFGFLDGDVGLTYALLSSYYVWLKFVKLRDLE